MVDGVRGRVRDGAPDAREGRLSMKRFWGSSVGRGAVYLTHEQTLRKQRELQMQGLTGYENTPTRFEKYFEVCWLQARYTTTRVWVSNDACNVKYYIHRIQR